MNSKAAYNAELRDKKLTAYTGIIKGLITQVQINPLFDYSEELEKIYKKNPEDRGIIFLAEKEAYKNETTRT